MVEKYVDPEGQYRIKFFEGIFANIVVFKKIKIWRFIIWNPLQKFLVLGGDLDDAYTDAVNFINQHKKLFPEVK